MSLIWFALTAVVFVLQLIPIPGIFLMMLMAPFWSVVTINIGFLSLAAEAYGGRISRWWLIAPAVWFGGCAALATFSHVDLHRLDADIRQQNEGKSIAFDPGAQALVFDETSKAFNGAAGAFIKTYDIPAVYAIAAGEIGATHRVHMIGGRTVCNRLRGDPRLRESRVFLSGVLEGRRLVDGVCEISAPRDPSLPTVTAFARTETHGGILLPYKLFHITVVDRRGQKIELAAGEASPFFWLPIPIIGCGLNSARAKWECSALLMRDKPRGLGGDRVDGGAAFDVVARALGLTASPVATRGTAIDATPGPDIEQILDPRLRLSLETLDRVIADPTRHITVHDVAGLSVRPALFVDRVDSIVPAIEKALASERSFETARVLEGLLAALPAERFSSVGPGILAVLGRRDLLTDRMVDNQLAMRLGDLGAAAVPTLVRLAFAEQSIPNAAAILGLCRAGAAARPVADRMAVEVSGAARTTSQAHEALFVTLLRLGRPDLAERGLDRVLSKSPKFEDWRRTVTPSSPPDLCTDARGWLRARF
ncbi:hypothetical protein [Rhodoplanes elegans]|uniref:hypothetical protein n=1 Tax=Rhodoplanes elegans TaxID=29408 RepID=UPI0011B94898|nr:hypothetical protein [Rhodoplanes elegans]